MTFCETKQLIRKTAKIVDGSFRQLYPNTYLEVAWETPSGKPFLASAVCTCGYKDKWSPEAGKEIALGMATAAIAKRYRSYMKRHLT